MSLRPGCNISPGPEAVIRTQHAASLSRGIVVVQHSVPPRSPSSPGRPTVVGPDVNPLTLLQSLEATAQQPLHGAPSPTWSVSCACALEPWCARGLTYPSGACSLCTSAGWEESAGNNPTVPDSSWVPTSGPCGPVAHDQLRGQQPLWSHILGPTEGSHPQQRSRVFPWRLNVKAGPRWKPPPHPPPSYFPTFLGHHRKLFYIGVFIYAWQRAWKRSGMFYILK